MSEFRLLSQPRDAPRPPVETIEPRNSGDTSPLSGSTNRIGIQSRIFAAA